jgi:hypothetical protein
LAGLAVLGLASTARAQAPAPGGGGQPPELSPPETKEGTKRAAAPDQRTGHVYVSLGAAANGPAGYMVSTVGAGTDAGTGVTGSALIGVGIGRHGSVQIFGDGTYFTSPGACISGCSGRSFSVGLGVTYHLAQGIAFDPWGSFGMAWRYTSILAPLEANVTQGSSNIPSGTLFQQRFQGWDIARIAFGGDFYPVPFFALGPFVEVDAGTNLTRNFLFQDVQVMSNGRLTYLDQHGLAPYAFFQIGVRLTFDPMRRGLARPVTPEPAPEPPPAPAAAAQAGPPSGM